MRARHFYIIAAIAGLVIVGGCAADGPKTQEMNAPARGLAYARQACASCHAVEPGQAISPTPSAPSFQALAGRPGFTRAALSALLRSPHRNMPALIVEPERIDDLAAYLAELGDGA